MSRLARIFQSQKFKRMILIFGGAFILLSFVIVWDPQPFLRYGYGGVFVFNLFGPGSLLIPVLVKYMNVWALAFVSAVGMTLNDSVSWVVGRSVDVVLPRSKKLERAENALHKYGFWFLLAWSIAPIPFDFIGLVAGYLKFPYSTVGPASLLGKIIRFLLLGSGAVALGNTFHWF